MTQAKTQKFPKAKTLLARLGVSALLAAATLAPLTSAQADPAHDYRRTLFISFGQKSVVLEAPQGMCFLDGSDYLQGAYLQFLQTEDPTKKTKGRAMALFGDCNEIMNLGTVNESPIGLEHKGLIVWNVTAANHGKSKLDLSDYLDMREASYLKDQLEEVGAAYKENGEHKTTKVGDNMSVESYMAAPSDYHFDKAVHRTADSVSVAYTLDSEVEYQKYQSTSIVATTLLRHLPIDVSINFTSKKREKTTKDMYALMDTFMAQQQMLNRQ